MMRSLTPHPASTCSTASQHRHRRHVDLRRRLPIAESIRAEAPEAHELLTTVPIQHIRRHPDEIDLRFRGRSSRLTSGATPAVSGTSTVRWRRSTSSPTWSSRCTARSRVQPPHGRSSVCCRDPRSPGDGMLIDNHRVMHGRTAFDPSSGRHIRLCHVPRTSSTAVGATRAAPCPCRPRPPPTPGLAHLTVQDLGRYLADPGYVLAVTSIETALLTAG